VRIGRQYGYIDKTGALAIPAQFSFARAFSNGLAGASIGRTSGWIDRSGRFVWQSAP